MVKLGFDLLNPLFLLLETENPTLAKLLSQSLFLDVTLGPVLDYQLSELLFYEIVVCDELFCPRYKFRRPHSFIFVDALHQGS